MFNLANKESNRTIATVLFPLKSALRQNDAKKDANVPVNVPVKLTDTQKNILYLISKNANITHSEIAKFLSITDKTAKRTTKALRELGLLKREGSDKTGFWLIFNKMIDNLFEQKKEAGFIEKEIPKEVVRELVKKYRHDFPNGRNPLTISSFGAVMERVWQISHSRGIDISRAELSSEAMKEVLSK